MRLVKSSMPVLMKGSCVLPMDQRRIFILNRYGKRERKRAPFSRSAVDTQRTSIALDEFPAKHEAETGAGLARGPLGAVEIVELYLFQFLWRDTHTRIFYIHRNLGIVLPGAKLYAAFVGRIFDGVGQKVAKDEMHHVPVRKCNHGGVRFKGHADLFGVGLQSKQAGHFGDQVGYADRLRLDGICLHLAAGPVEDVLHQTGRMGQFIDDIGHHFLDLPGRHIELLHIAEQVAQRIDRRFQVMCDDGEKTVLEGVDLRQFGGLLLEQLLIRCDGFFLFQDALLIAGILFFDEEEAEKDKYDGHQLVDQVEKWTGRRQLIGVVLADHGQDEIADHRKPEGEQHLADFLDEEHRQDAIEDKEELHTHIDPPGINDAREQGVENKIGDLRHVMHTTGIEHHHQDADTRRHTGDDPGREGEVPVAEGADDGNDDPGYELKKIELVEDAQLSFFIVIHVTGEAD